jgi:predicted amidohydrolase YtcJ
VHSFEGRTEWECLDALRAEGDLSLRVTRMIHRDDFELALERGLRTGEGDAWLRWGCLKLFSDGTLGLRTARMLEPYASGGIGDWITPPEEMIRLAGRAAAAGIGTAIHAIGDAAVRGSLDALESVRARSDLPLRIEHAQILSPEDLPRFARSRITASMQPIHFETDREGAWREWGPRCDHAYAWRRLLDSGAELILGTDAPIEPLNPWSNMAAAMRQTGRDPRAGDDASRPLGFDQALAAMTCAPYRAMGQVGGGLLPGQPADFVLVNRSVKALETGEYYAAVKPLLTAVEGRIVYAAGPFAGFSSL